VATTHFNWGSSPAGRHRQAVGRRQRGFGAVDVHRQGDVGAAFLAHRPEAGPVGDRRGGAGGQGEVDAAGGVDGEGDGGGDRQGLADDDVARRQGGAGQLGHQPVGEQGEGDLHGQVALGQGEAEVGERAAAPAAPDQQGRPFGADQHLVTGSLDALGPGHADLGQVDAGQHRVIGVDEGHRRPFDLTSDPDAGGAPRRGDGQERGTRVGRDGHAVVDGEVESRRRPRLSGALDLQRREGGQEPVEVQVLGAGVEDLEGPAPAGDGEGVVVGGQQVLAFEERLHPVTAGQVDLSFHSGAGGDVDPLPVGGAGVDVEPQLLGRRRPAGVAEGDAGVEAAAPRLHGEAGDGPVGRPRPHALVVGAGREHAPLGVGQPAVGEEHEAHRRAGRLHAFGQGEGGGEVGGAGAAPDGVHRVVERVAVRAGRQDHPGLGAGHHHAGDAAGGQLAPQAASPVLGRFQPVGLAVDGGHRPRSIDDEDGVEGELGPGGPHRLGHGGGQQGHRQQLQGQQHARSQLLPRRRHRDRPGHLPPQEGGADLHRRPLGPQHVQGDDRERQQGQPQAGGVGEPHDCELAAVGGQ
jgi:hypothetical protein